MKAENIEIKPIKTKRNNTTKKVFTLAKQQLNTLLKQISQQLNLSQLSQFK